MTLTVVVALIPGLKVWCKSFTKSSLIVWLPGDRVSGIPFVLVQIVTYWPSTQTCMCPSLLPAVVVLTSLVCPGCTNVKLWTANETKNDGFTVRLVFNAPPGERIAMLHFRTGLHCAAAP